MKAADRAARAYGVEDLKEAQRKNQQPLHTEAKPCYG